MGMAATRIPSPVTGQIVIKSDPADCLQGLPAQLG